MTSPWACPLSEPCQANLPNAPRHLQAGSDNKLQPAVEGASLCSAAGSQPGSRATSSGSSL